MDWAFALQEKRHNSPDLSPIEARQYVLHLAQHLHLALEELQVPSVAHIRTVARLACPACAVNHDSIKQSHRLIVLMEQRH